MEDRLEVTVTAALVRRQHRYWYQFAAYSRVSQQWYRFAAVERGVTAECRQQLKNSFENTAAAAESEIGTSSPVVHSTVGTVQSADSRLCEQYTAAELAFQQVYHTVRSVPEAYYPRGSRNCDREFDDFFWDFCLILQQILFHVYGVDYRNPTEKMLLLF